MSLDFIDQLLTCNREGLRQSRPAIALGERDDSPPPLPPRPEGDVVFSDGSWIPRILMTDEQKAERKKVIRQNKIEKMTRKLAVTAVADEFQNQFAKKGQAARFLVGPQQALWLIRSR